MMAVAAFALAIGGTQAKAQSSPEPAAQRKKEKAVFPLLGKSYFQP